MEMRIRINEIDNYHNNDKNNKGNKDNLKSNDNDQKLKKKHVEYLFDFFVFGVLSLHLERLSGLPCAFFSSSVYRYI